MRLHIDCLLICSVVFLNMCDILAIAAPPFDVLSIDFGDQAWGLNCMKVQVRNTTDVPRALFIHIGGKSDGDISGGFGMGDSHSVPPGEQTVEHWYWMPPTHGTTKAEVKFVVPTTDAPWEESPFLTKTSTISFALPNDRCNNLMITDRIPDMRKFVPENTPRIAPLKYLKTDHFVFYFSPDTPAAKDIDTLSKDHEAALSGACDLLKVQPTSTIAVFFYPDGLTKKMCTQHEGEGWAIGHTIAQVYNKETRLDPLHEITHVVAAEVGDPPAMFSEGLATWMAKDHIWNGEPVDTTVARLAKGGMLVPLKDILARTEIGARPNDGKVAYPQAASFVGYLIVTFGTEKFLQVYRTLQNGDTPEIRQQNKARVKEVVGQSLEETEMVWREALAGFD